MALMLASPAWTAARVGEYGDRIERNIIKNNNDYLYHLSFQYYIYFNYKYNHIKIFFRPFLFKLNKIILKSIPAIYQIKIILKSVPFPPLKSLPLRRRKQNLCLPCLPFRSLKWNDCSLSEIGLTLLSSAVFPNMSDRSKQQRKMNRGAKNAIRIIKRPSPQPEVQDIEDAVSSFSEDETQKLRVALLDWYDHNRRDLPWRRTSSNNAGCKEEEEEEEEVDSRAYAVWVSEVMLQQTRVQTVIDYYNRWMEKWPTIHDLAQASLEEVNEMWAGLGYYRRARFLLEGAKRIVAERGRIPNTVSTLRKIPGIGDYTAGAIASIAFQEAVPVVDGNVVRVTARLKAVSANPKDSVTIKRFWKLAAQLVDPLRPGDFNQALMELGATVCTPLNPSCSSCPASKFCNALSISKDDGSVLVTDYPVKGVKVKQRCDFCAVCVVELLGSGGKLDNNQSSSEFILVKRPNEGLLAGLWEFPSVPLDGETDSLDRREAANRFLKSTLKIDTKKSSNIVLREDIGEFVHIFSHIRLKLYVELLVLQLKGRKDDSFKSQGNETITCKWVDGNALSSMGLTTSVRKVYSMVQKFKQKNFPCKQVTPKKRSRTTQKLT